MEDQTDDVPDNETVNLFASTKCAYCDCPKDGVLVFHCEKCSNWVHATCLHSRPPSSILADNYFVFKCVTCTGSGKESFDRMKLTWSQVTQLALYNLSQSSLGNKGYFKWKEDLCNYIETHWDLLFGANKKKVAQWSCTVCSTLSAGNPHKFQSGYGVFKDAGWWRLANPTKPPEYIPGVSTATPRVKTRKFFGSSRSSSRKRAQSILHRLNEAKQSIALKKHVESVEDTDDVSSPASSTVEDNSPSASPFPSDLNGSLKKKLKIDAALPFVALSDDSDTENMINECCVQDGLEKFAGKTSTTERKFETNLEDLSGNKLQTFKSEAKAKPVSSARNARSMNLYEEEKLLNKIDNSSRLNNRVAIRRLRRKLLLRQERRKLDLPQFNFDSVASRLLAKEKKIILPKVFDIQDCLHTSTAPSALYSFHHRILDRFLSADVQLLNTDKLGRTFQQKLVGSDESRLDKQSLIISPYTQRILKPFIRRDFESRPLKLRQLMEVVARVNSETSTVPSSPIEFCYLRPDHVPTINAMCCQFFWPGIDLSESLQHPDFTVVALYKKMVVGFGFLVPDVSFNEAYVSFLFVHPDWRRAGIGTFMLYHLMQTCMGKDVTLHVSASNPAMLLYQRFGFKPERFDANFYDKYLPVDTKACPHAFFMRLRR